MCVIARRFFIPPNAETNMTKRKAHEIKPGDRINGIEVFDGLQKGFDGYYLPMVDGTRVKVPTPDTVIETE